MQTITVEAVLNAAAEVAPELNIPFRDLPDRELVPKGTLLGVVCPERFAKEDAPVRA